MEESAEDSCAWGVSWPRLFSDAFGRIGLLDFSDMKQRKRWIGALAFVIPALWALVFQYWGDPVRMVLSADW